jgi:hypothetical protein
VSWLRSGPFTIGQVQTFAALTPIRPGHEQPLRSYLAGLREDASPLSRVPGTHYARWVVIPRLHHQGHPQKPDVLKSQYLLFSACFDGLHLDPYLASLRIHLATEADAIWGHCIGYNGVADLCRYLRHNRITANLFLADLPGATVDEVEQALDVRRRTQRFMLDHGRVDNAAELCAAWRQEFGNG